MSSNRLAPRRRPKTTLHYPDLGIARRRSLNGVAYPKEYRERVEKFLRNYIWRKITGDITTEFLEAAVERMFNADEVSGAVDLAKLKELKHRIVQLFLYANEPGRNHYGSSDTL